MSELRRLRYFLAVAEERNFTRAAERLLVAQPALSRQIRQLEQELGVQLFQRSTHAVDLTEAGSLLQERGRELCALEDRMLREVRGFADGGQGRLVFGSSTASSYETAPALLAALAEDAPGLTVDSRLLPTAELVSGVADGTLDAALVRCPPPTPGLVRTLVRLEPQGVLMRADHALAAVPAAAGCSPQLDRIKRGLSGPGEPIALTALRGTAVLLHPREANPGHYDAVVGLFARADLADGLRIVERRAAFDPTHGLVLSGEAVSVVGASVLSGLPGGLVWRPLAPLATVELHLLTRARPVTPAVTRLLRSATAVARREAWLRPS